MTSPSCASPSPHIGRQVSTHRAPSLHCVTPPRNATINVQDETPLHWSLEPVYTSKNDATRGKRHNNAAVIRSTDLGFPPEVADSGLKLLNSDAFNKGTTPNSAAIAGLGSNRKQVFTQIYSNGLHQASCARIVHHRGRRVARRETTAADTSSAVRGRRPGIQPLLAAGAKPPSPIEGGQRGGEARSGQARP